MKKSWDKKISAVLTATLILTVAPVSTLAQPNARITQSNLEDVYVDIIGEGERSTLPVR